MKRIAFLLVFCLATLYSFGQDTATSLDEVVVTATKTNIKESETGKVVTVIGSAELQRNEGRSLGQILDLQPGLTINGAESAPGTNLYVFERGAADGYTMILLDGVVVYDPSQTTSHFDLNLIPVDIIDHIEIIRGAASTLYGSGAVAGVINIITKQGASRPLQVNAGLTAGSYGTFSEQAGLGGSHGGIDYNLQFVNYSSVGFPAAVDTTGTGHFTNDGMRVKTLNFNLGFHPSKSFRLNPFIRYSDENGNIPQAAFTDDPDYTYGSQFLQAGLQGILTAHATTVHLIYSYAYTQRNYLDDTFSENANYYQESDISHQQDAEIYLNTNLSRKVSLLAGLQELYSTTNQSSLSISNYGPYATALSPDSARAGLSSAYLSLFLTNDTGFNLEVGGRLNDHTAYGFNPTFTLNPFWSFAGHHKVFLNIASTFNAPSLYQLYSPYGNPGLQPEQGMSYEAGYEKIWENQGILFRITGFIRNLRDVIAYTTAYVNFNQQHDQGGELEMDWDPLPSLSLKGFYAYATGSVTAQGSGKADTVYNDLYRRPAGSFAIRASWKATQRFGLSSDLKWVGARSDLDFNNYPAAAITLDPYLLWNLHLDYSGKKIWRVFLDLNNITNSSYMEVLGYTTRKFNFDAGLTVNL